jgi:hypothetical protein
MRMSGVTRIAIPTCKFMALTFVCAGLSCYRKSLFGFIVGSQIQESTGAKSVQICLCEFYVGLTVHHELCVQ